LDSIMLCAHDLMLPDFPTLHTRMLLLAWEVGLDRVSEESAKLLLLSLQASLNFLVSFVYNVYLLFPCCNVSESHPNRRILPDVKIFTFIHTRTQLQPKLNCKYDLS
jgi:hypothetical protein